MIALLRPGRVRHLPGVCLAIGLAGCAVSPPAETARCPDAYGKPNLSVMLFFGRSTPDHGEVSDRQWAQFVDQVVTPNLPSGFTVFDAAGAWMSPAGRRTEHEATKVLLVALPPAPDALAPVQRIRHAYQTQFHQQLVGMTVEPACAAF